VNLISGMRYKITYQVPGQHKKPRVAVLDFMEKGEGDKYFFSARPIGGTQTFYRDWIIKAEPALDITPIYMKP